MSERSAFNGAKQTVRIKAWLETVLRKITATGNGQNADWK